MKAETIKALRSSVRKWDKIADGEAYSQGPDNCPLCKLFYAKSCKGCPVLANTKRLCCDGTPYAVWEDLPSIEKRVDENDDSKEWTSSELSVSVARAEANYLRALLPQRARRE